MDYIALGDSFSSGEGETDDSYYLRGTNDTFEKCHISSRSYPFLLARSMRIDTEAMRSVACSGAKTNDVIGADKAYIGQDNRFGIDKLNISFDAISIAQTYASEHFMPGRIHQERFISRTHPKIATISIGGNDIFLFRKLQPCLSYGTCTLAGTPKGREQTALEIRSLFTTLVNTYTELRNTSPQTELYVVGYPKIIDPNGICSGILGQLLDPAEKRYMDETISYINQVISAAAKKVGVRYIDISDAFGDQRLCGSTTSSAMNGIRLGDDSVPVGPFNLIGAESFHPNPKGNVMITNTIINSVGNLFNHRYCASGVVFCQTDVTVPEPSSYWLPDGITHGYSSLQSRDFMHDTPSDKYDKIISLPANSLQPGSTVRVEVHSNPTVLADTSAKDDGSLDLTVRLPTNLEQGFHTLYLYGTTYSGEQVDFYQIFQHSQNVTTTPQSPQSADMTTHPTVSSVSIKNESDSVASVQTSSNPINTGVVLGESDTKNTAPPSIWPYYLSATSLLIVVLSILIRRYIKRHCGSS
jgi:lysophospholipase L1-like esterase